MTKKILIFIGVGMLIASLGIGGYLFLIPRCPESCDDGNPCTQDFCSSETNYQCRYSPVVGFVEGCQDLVEACRQHQCVAGRCQIITLTDCCGNQKCEPGEDWETCPQDCERCDDNNKCTKDEYDYYKGECINEPIIPCCGNSVCETGETYKNCAKDCPNCDDGNPCTQDFYSYKIDECSYIKLSGEQQGCSAEVLCGTQTCRAGVCQIKYVSDCCGNSICEMDETYKTCSKDCPNCDDNNKCTKDHYDYHQQKCVNTPIIDVICCGNSVCETGETYKNCAKDCVNCDDDNECTRDSYDYYKQECVNEIITPCCGNGICDEGVETYSSCPTDCPSCDDNNRLTADSFDYETQECEHIVTHYFIDDFEDGTQNWDFYGTEEEPTINWTTIVEDGNTVLKGINHNWTSYCGEWNNYIFKFRFKKIKGSLNVNFRHDPFAEDGWDRYFVALWKGTWIGLQKQFGPAESIQQLKGISLNFDEDWHTFEIRGYDNILNVYMDNKLLIKYKDITDSVLSGRIGFETQDDSEFLFDDVEVKVISEEDIIYP